MSRRRVYSQTTLAIMERYFAALERCRQLELIRNVAVFCDANGIDKRHLYAQKKDLGRGLFEVGWLVPLIRDFHVSTYWLLTGQGEMFG